MTEEAPVLGAATTEPAARALWRVTPDGVRLRVLIWRPARAQGTVLLLPGRTEHAEKYAATAARLAGAGYATATLDWRGQGLSDRLLPDPRKGHVRHFADYQADLGCLLQTVAALDLPARHYLLAHSMGGCIGLRALTRGLAVQAAAFSAPMWGIKVPKDRNHLAALSAGLLARSGFGARYAPHPATGPVCYAESAPFEGNLLTTDPQEWAHLQATLRAEPRLVIAGPTIGWVNAALGDCRSLAQTGSPATPCLTLVGSEEKIVRLPAIEDRMARWPGGDLLQLPGARHELLMESPALRERAFAAILSHFARHSAA